MTEDTEYKLQTPVYKVASNESGEYGLYAANEATMPADTGKPIILHWHEIGTFDRCEAANAVYNALKDPEKSEAGWPWADEVLRESDLYAEIENVLDDSEYDPDSGEYRYFTDTGRCVAVTPMGEVVEKPTDDDEFRVDRFTWEDDDLELVEEES